MFVQPSMALPGLILLAAFAHIAQGQSCYDYGDCDSCINNGEITTCGWCIDDQTCRPSNDDQSCASYESPTSYEDFTSRVVDSNSDINPKRTTAYLRVGHPVTVTFEVVAPLGKPIDFFFLFDSSASMEDDMDSIVAISNDLRASLEGLCNVNPSSPNPSCVKMQIANFIDRPQNVIQTAAASDFTKRVYPFRFGLGYESGEFIEFKDSNGQSNNFVDAVAETKENRIIGNYDTPEVGFDAMMQAISCAKWNPESRHLLFVGTDAQAQQETEYSAAYSVKSGWDREDLIGRWALLQKRNQQKCWIKTFSGSSDAEIRDAQLREAHYNCMNDDAPSASKLKQSLLEQNVIPIFATIESAKVKNFWSAFQDSIGFGSSGTLSQTSTNIISLIEDAYENIQATIQLEPVDNGAGRNVFIKSIDDPKTNVDLGQAYTMKVTLEATKDTPELSDSDDDEANPPLTLLALGIGQVEIKIKKLTCDCYANPEDLKDGVCSCGICTCDATSPSCPVDPANGLECSGTGACTCGTCRCQEASGEACECPTGNSACPIALNGQVCGGDDQGSCVCGECKCKDNFSGLTCDCPAVKPTCEIGVNCINGVCASNNDATCEHDVCVCNGSYTGDDCNCAACDSTCSAERGQGNCISTGEDCGKCECSAGYDPDTNCLCKLGDMDKCPIVNGKICDGKGECVCGECQCFSGYGGDDCTCGLFLPCAADADGNVCGGNGECVCGECVCNVGPDDEKLYADEGCTCPLAETCPESNGLECGGADLGTCLRTAEECGKCKCSEGRAGDACSCAIQECPIANSKDCNGHGNCNECGVCECDEGFSGDSCLCEIADNPCDAEETCGGKGTCQYEDDQCGVCKCDENYIGDKCECDIRSCPVVDGFLCGEYGVSCTACTRECVCQEGYKQPTPDDGCICRSDVCGDILLPNGTNYVCAGRGTCGAADCGCTCDPGFIGQDCSECDNSVTVSKEVLRGDFCNGTVVESPETCEESVCAPWCEDLGCDECSGERGCAWCGSSAKCFDAVRVYALCTDQGRVNEKCTDDPNVTGIIAGVAGGILGLVFLIIGVVKGIAMYLDRREWAAHHKALEGMQWNNTANPHFEPLTTETINPVYNGGS
eukprot:CFRG6586T1